MIEEKGPGRLVDFFGQSIDFINGLRVGRMARLKKLLSEKPLILAVETISVCNAKCVFCAYPTMKRKHELMPISVFEKIVQEYAQVGGGALSLTPVMGDLLLDPHLIERLKILEKFENIDQVSFTTNGIAVNKFTDEELKYILQRVFLIQFSIGGLDPETYKKLYQVDKLDDVLAAVQKVLQLKEDIQSPTHIILAFRTDNQNFEQEYAKQLEEFKRQGVFISHIASYNNYGGEIQSQEIRIKRNRVVSKRLPCALTLLHAHAYSNGKMTNCGCVDANGNGLIIGDSKEQTFGDIWQGERRKRLLNSFSEGKLPKLCQGCNAYRPLTYLGSGVFKNVKSHHRLPLEFYLNFFGG